MTRRKTRKATEQNVVSRKVRIEKLLAAGWIASAAEIPPDAIPVDPGRINLGGSWFHPTFFQTLQFTCVDCGAPQTWEAEDQRWYYENSGAPYYATATRCRACRKKEQARKVQAQIASGHANRQSKYTPLRTDADGGTSSDHRA